MALAKPQLTDEDEHLFIWKPDASQEHTGWFGPRPMISIRCNESRTVQQVAAPNRKILSHAERTTAVVYQE